MRVISMLLLGVLASAAPLSSSQSGTINFGSVSQKEKRNIKNPDEVDFGIVGDTYKRSIKSPDEVDFNVVGDTY
ncbi:hypothetical protein SCUP515_11409 [Seiridium cupressi]